MLLIQHTCLKLILQEYIRTITTLGFKHRKISIGKRKDLSRFKSSFFRICRLFISASCLPWHTTSTLVFSTTLTAFMKAIQLSITIVAYGLAALRASSTLFCIQSEEIHMTVPKVWLLITIGLSKLIIIKQAYMERGKFASWTLLQCYRETSNVHYFTSNILVMSPKVILCKLE